METTTKENERTYARILARAWSDDDFRARIVSDPTTTLRESGLHLDNVQTVSLDETTPVAHWEPSTATLTLPFPPQPTGLRDDPLGSAVGDDDNGITICCCCC